MSHNVDVIGPISGADRGRTGHREDYHVHAADCASSKRYSPAEIWTFEARSQVEVAGEVFSDIMAESGESAASYLGEFWFAPCCDLPADNEPVPYVPNDAA